MRLGTLLVLALGTDGDAATIWVHSVTPAPWAMLLDERFSEGRLAGQHAWHPCTTVDGHALVPEVRCGSPASTSRSDPLAAERESGHRLENADSATLFHAWAVGSLRDSSGHAVDLLRRAAERSPTDARVLNDLAVAYLDQGVRDQRLETLLRALDTAERALALDPTLIEAQYNEAVAAERLYMISTAREAWARYAGLERDPRWRSEALARLEALEEQGDTASWESLEAGLPAIDTRRIATRVARSPNGARDFTFTLLGRWGSAMLEGRTAEAASMLNLAREIGAAGLRMGGDRTVARAVRTIDVARGDPARIRALAMGHVALDSGYTQFLKGKHHQALPSLRRAEIALRGQGSACAGWAGYFRAASLIYLADYAPADSILRDLSRSAGDAQLALAGRATWALGTSRVKRGRPDEARQFYRAARPPITRAREREYEGALHALVSESLEIEGQHSLAQAEAFQGLRLLSQSRRSTYYNTQLTIVWLTARGAGLRHAGLAVTHEKVGVTRVSGGADVLAQALRVQARARLALGDTAGARTDLHEAARVAESIPPGNARNRVVADVEVVRAESERDPAAALARMERVIHIYGAQQIGVYLPDALAQAAAAARALGRLDTAWAYLESAVRQVEQLQEKEQTLENRISRLETLEGVFDATIGLALERGDTATALGYLERARRAAWPPGEWGLPASDSVSLERLRAAVPAGTWVMEYAVLPDRLITWAVSRDSVRQLATAITRDSLAALATRFAEAGYQTVSATSAGARLYDLLIRPLQRELSPETSLVLVPDRELNQVPFAALAASRTGHRLVEDHAITVVPSAAFLLAVRERAGTRRNGVQHALVVGEPAIDPALGLPSLPAAAREAEDVARWLRPRPTLLAGPLAKRGEVVRLLPRSTLFHFAGHAVFNAERPELSYLALAPDSAGGTGVLLAREIGDLAATNLMTVVLSACSTLSPRPTHAGAPAGLAYSFLRAGAPATVSTMWDVSDETTSSVIVEFHRRVAAGTPAAEALRLAQVAALRSSRVSQRAPVAWAAFIYTGP